MKIFHSLPVKQLCCSTRSDATEWFQEKKDNIDELTTG